MDSQLSQVLVSRFGVDVLPHAVVGIDSYHVDGSQLIGLFNYLKTESTLTFEILFDLSAIDETERGGGFTVFYHLLSISTNQFISIRTHIE